MGYKELKVWEKAYEMSLRIHHQSQTFPKHEQYELGSQIRRASKSVVLNIAEGYGRNTSEGDFKRFLMMSMGSSEEVLVILKYCRDLDYISEEDYNKYRAGYEEISKMLYTLHKNWRDMRSQEKI